MRTWTYLLLLLLATTAGAPLLAQEHEPPPPPDSERLREIKAQKAAYLTAKLALTPQQAERFWPVYNEYDEAQDALRRSRFENMRSANRQGSALTDEEARKALKKGLDLRQQEVDLERRYTDQFITHIGAVKTLELHKAERDFQKEVLRRVKERMEDRQAPRQAPLRDRR